MSTNRCLLDTGPLVALLNKNDHYHEQAKKIFAQTKPPFITCESVISEACFLVSRHHPDAAQEILSWGTKKVFVLPFQAENHLLTLTKILKKYSNIPASFADACLIQCATLYKTPHIATFDSDFKIYRWSKNESFHIIDGE